MKISIIGQAGSGKSTLARRISEKLSIQHLHIDKFWFEAIDKFNTKEDIRAYIRENVENFLEKNEDWVSDGWYSRIQPLITKEADEVIFLDVPFSRRLINHLKRTFLRNNKNKGVSFWGDIRFVYQIIRRTFIHGPKIKEFVKNNAHKVRHFKNYEDVNGYLESLKKF